MSPVEALRRYSSICPDWPGFAAALLHPQPVSLRPHPERINATELISLLADAGLPASPADWDASSLRLRPDASPGQHWGYFAGLFQVQEEAAQLPVRLLDPQPGERVLDLCAAPGNKTAQVALAMGNRGLVVANELQSGRLPALRQLVRRLGLRNVLIHRGAGESLPGVTGPYDRVLVDAPCSGEGTWRKYRRHRREVARRIDERERDDLAARQTRLLDRAVRLCRPGGRIVYSTCTYAPEENEAVVDAILRHHGDRLSVETASVEGFAVSEGVKEWAGQRYDPRLARALRIWPGITDTGGFFVVVLHRHGAPGEAMGQSRAEPAHEASQTLPADPATDAVLTRFGIDAACLRGLEAGPDGGRYLHYRVAGQSWPARAQPDAFGLAAIGLQVKPFKPTTALALWLAPAATRNCVALDATQTAAFLRRQPIALDDVKAAKPLDGPGFVLLTHAGHGLGVARLNREGQLESQFPKAWVNPNPGFPVAG
ncbi:RsmB/NOP family class I SAM-dependent RNA methyltransferase [Spiribacter insolitus]|uniref:RsmB/NOP family class I SAM-dependent RNA methyltransferase n=1 Tax=Spiribacter insolitus TaxID=3122417 RepID=A0ABV3T653_9GAMM